MQKRIINNKINIKTKIKKLKVQDNVQYFEKYLSFIVYNNQYKFTIYNTYRYYRLIKFFN